MPNKRGGRIVSNVYAAIAEPATSGPVEGNAQNLANGHCAATRVSLAHRALADPTTFIALPSLISHEEALVAGAPVSLPLSEILAARESPMIW
jgi:hypothetical protein